MNLSTSYHILFSLCYVFIATFVVFPGVFFDSYWSFLDDKKELKWYTLITILIFNVCDTIGRKLGGKFMLSTGKVISGSFLRTILIMIVILIAIDDAHSTYFFE